MTRLDEAASALPIGAAIGDIRAALTTQPRLVLQAEPGAGKTTIVPLALLDEPWCTGTIVVLEPRRLAVRAAARRMADILGERPGERVGWRMRQDTKVSGRTRIEVVTEGILTRRLQRDPELTGVSAIVFDEFHERSLHADLGLALTVDLADALRPDLRLVVMSATLDAEPVASLLDAPTITVQGRSHPVETIHLETDRRARVEGPVVAAIGRALSEQAGDVLVFLPGAAEIARVERGLETASDVDVRPLHGSMAPQAQDAAIAPSPPGRRKVVLSTAIAETSLTIEGVRSVVDAGLRRTPRLDPGVGMSRLVTLPVTRAEADQRRGRAGRLGPGVCYRLWSRSTEATMRAHPEPAILTEDLTSLVLEVAAWGASVGDLRWLDRPPERHVEAAESLLRLLDAFDERGLTSHGRQLSSWPLHPRLAHMVVRSHELGDGALAADLAAVLGEGDLFRGRDRPTDVMLRVRALRNGDPRARRPTLDRVRRDAASFRRRLDLAASTSSSDDRAGALLSLAYPDRIGTRRPGQLGNFHLTNGRGASVAEHDVFARADHIVCAELDGRRDGARIFLAASISLDEIREFHAGRIVVENEVTWDDQSRDVVARRVERLGEAALTQARATSVDHDAAIAALLTGIRRLGIDALPWSDEMRQLQAKLSLLHQTDRSWPAVDDDALLADLDERLGPHLPGARRWRDVERLDLRPVLLHGLDHRQRQRLDELMPDRLSVPSGNSHRIDYTAEGGPVLAVKVQEMFGATDTPAVADGRIPVVLHLLSPAGRPVQVTRDLVSFWASGYAAVRSDLRGRYPKHPWPEDPTQATATAKTSRRR